MEKISFVTNTSVNTIDHVKLLMRSLKENLKNKEHEILVFVDSDNENTTEYLKSIKSEFCDLKIITHGLHPCIGYSRNNNLLVELSKYDIVSYLQSDMVICKDYDEIVINELEENTILSSTRIEPPLHGESPITITKDFGLNPTKFNMDEFVLFSESQKQDKEFPFFFAPLTFHKSTWESVGGYDTLFRRSREDSDFLMRALKSGIKIKQTFKANVYHFTCVSSRGKNWFDLSNSEARTRTQIQNLADNIEMMRFIRKWGNFSHGEIDLVKYDIDFVFPNKISNAEELQTVLNIEPFVSKVWLSCQEDVDKCLKIHENDHSLANNLLNFSSEDWERSKPFYNNVNFEEIFKVGHPTEYNILMNITGEQLNLPSLQGIHQLLYYSDIGIYEWGAFRIDMNNKIDVSEKNVIVRNPEFDKSLIFII